MKAHKSQHGISLIEIMIALLIGLFLMGGLIQLFISSKQTYKVQDTVGRLQENQRFALDFLVHDMRGIGGWGCFKDASAHNLLNPVGVFAQATSGITGENNHVSSGAGDSVLAGTDSITLYSTSAILASDGTDVALTAISSNETADLAVTANSGIKATDILFIGDCEEGAIFQATTGTGGTTIEHKAGAPTTDMYPNNSTNSLSKPYNRSARLYKFNAVTYSIYKASKTDNGGSPALFKSVNGAAADELIEGVEDMQILYGEDTDSDGTPNRYVPAGTLGLNMGNVVSVRVSLLMRSLDDNQANKHIPFKFEGVTVPASLTDKRIRRSITSIISIRNRLN